MNITVNAAGDRLHDVIFNDAFAPQNAAKDAKAEDRGELGSFDRKSQDQRRIAD
jgi:hypothetical protein